MCNKGQFEVLNGIQIDRCLVPQIKRMWELKIKTFGCCCGHGKRKGFISIPLSHAEKAIDNNFELLLPAKRMPDKWNKFLGVKIEAMDEKINTNS